MARLRGTIAADRLKGSNGEDDIFGNAGNDTLHGFGGNDALEGGKGNDRLVGGAGNDELHGGSGKDVFVFTSGHDDIEDFHVRDDRISLDTSFGIGSFAELMRKASIVDNGEDILFNFGKGNTLRLDDVDIKSLKAEHFGFKTGLEVVVPPTTKHDRLVGTAGNDVLDGGLGNDMLYGHAGNDTLKGGAGHDDLEGGKGNDRLYGGSGNDDLEGGAGHDRLDGGSGRNELEGGSGSDTFVFSTGISEIADFRAGTDRVEMSRTLGVANFTEMMKRATVIDGGDDVRIDFGSASLTFEDTALAELKAADFLFV